MCLLSAWSTRIFLDICRLSSKGEKWGWQEPLQPASVRFYSNLNWCLSRSWSCFISFYPLPFHEISVKYMYELECVANFHTSSLIVRHQIDQIFGRKSIFYFLLFSVYVQSITLYSNLMLFVELILHYLSLHSHSPWIPCYQISNHNFQLWAFNLNWQLLL